MSRWWPRTLVFGAVLVHVVPACVGGDDSLNPQPLPPQDERGDEPQTPGSSTGGSTSSGSGGNGAESPPPGADASTDGGTEGGDQ